eukprot:PhM_4_TR13305/c0_g1_i1/m.77158
MVLEQHNCAVLEACGFTIVKVPKKQTHIFQPADQYIIANIKELACQAWGNYVEDTFAKQDVDEAVQEISVTSLPVVRGLKLGFLIQAIERCTSATVLASWERCGILREMFCEVPQGTVVPDIYTQDNDCVGCGDRRSAQQASSQSPGWNTWCAHSRNLES